MTHASICSGLDGPALAAAWLGWENLFHADINEFTNHILKYFYQNATHYTDIRTTDFTPWRGRVDVLTAGFPCQPFSVAGKRTGQDHDSYLWPETLRVVGQVRPRWFVGENVDGITSMVFPGQETAVGTQTDLFGTAREVYERIDRYIIDRICCDLESIGYEVQPVAIPACAVGAPHERMRVFFICHDTHAADAGTEKERERTEGVLPHVAAADPDSDRLREWEDKQISFTECLRETDNRLGCQNGITSDADCERRPKRHAPSESGETKERDCASGHEIPDWNGFPTQSPVCCGDDGFPGRISGITVPGWRREAIKALGNAIVPQQIYEILRLIEIIENQ